MSKESSKVEVIEVIAAAEHNLKNVSCTIPKGKVSVISGPSGAGKTSLAIDTIFAESAYRLNALNTVLNPLKGNALCISRPKVKKITGLPPVYYRKEKTLLKNHTVASFIGLDLLFAELFKRHGERPCPSCKKGEIIATTHTSAAEECVAQASGFVAICGVIKSDGLSEEEALELFNKVLLNASSRVVFQGKIIDLDDDEHLKGEIIKLYIKDKQPITVVVDRLDPSQDSRRLKQALNLAESLQSNGVVTLELDSKGDVRSTSAKHFAESGICNRCGYTSFVVSEGIFSCKLLGDATFNGGFKGLEGFSYLSATQQEEFLTYRLGGYLLEDLLQKTTAELLDLLRPLSETDSLVNLLNILQRLGLGHLSALRTCKTLSNGELQRVQLVNSFNRIVRGTLLVLDEPTSGLHDLDIPPLLKIFQEFSANGVGLLLVENNRQVLAIADHQIILGEGAGIYGGNVIYEGKPQKREGKEKLKVGRAKNIDRSFFPNEEELQKREGKEKLKVAHSKNIDSNSFPAIHLKGVTVHNLKSIDVDFPLRSLTCVSGVSGAGKSSLVFETLLPALKKVTKLPSKTSFPYTERSEVNFSELICDEGISRVVAAPLASEVLTPRSFVAGYVGIFPFLKTLFSQLPLARMRGFKEKDFSFVHNACAECGGTGWLPSGVCHLCKGQHFNEALLEVKFKGLSISEILDRSAAEVVDIIGVIPRCRERLELLKKFHLDYLPLKQPLNSVSYGELQRLKFVKEFSRSSKPAIYLFDEPASGLDDKEIVNLLTVFQEFIKHGNTIIAIEHRDVFVKGADWIVDLGRSAGAKGGALVAQGSFEDVVKNERSATAALQ